MLRWKPDDTTGLHGLFMAYIQEKVGLIAQSSSDIVIEDIFWVQGEADSNSRAESYPSMLAEMMSAINSLYPFRLVFSQLKGSTLQPARAVDTQVINQGVIDAGYITTVDNNDLTFLPETPLDLHYDAASINEIGRRLAFASQAN